MIKIKEGPEIQLSRTEYEKLVAEYRAMQCYMVNPPSFETWVLNKLQQERLALLARYAKSFSEGGG